MPVAVKILDPGRPSISMARRAHQPDENTPTARAAKAIGPRHLVECDVTAISRISDCRQNECLDREPKGIQPAVPAALAFLHETSAETAPGNRACHR